MNGDIRNIEWIVAEVLRRLSELANAPTSNEPEPTVPEPRPAAAQPDASRVRDTSELVVDQRVVSLASIGEQLAGKKRLVVQPNAVVTPSVRDELRKRGIKLERQAEADLSAAATAELVVMLSSPSPAADRLATQATQLGCGLMKCSDLQVAAAQISERLGAGGTTGIWLTDVSMVAQTLANREGHVRACSANNLTEVQAGRAAIATNLVVADPKRVSEFQWKQMIGTLAQESAGECPAALRMNR